MELLPQERLSSNLKIACSHYSTHADAQESRERACGCFKKQNANTNMHITLISIKLCIFTTKNYEMQNYQFSFNKTSFNLKLKTFIPNNTISQTVYSAPKFVSKVLVQSHHRVPPTT